MMHLTALRFSTKPHRLFMNALLKLAKNQRQFPEEKAKETALFILLFATTGITGVFFLLLLVSYFAAGNTQVAERIFVALAALAYMSAISLLAIKQKRQIASLLLVAYYIAIGGMAAWQWGINMPFAVLIMNVTITLAAVVLGARLALYTAAVMTGLILVIQYLSATNIHKADLSWQHGAVSEIGDTLSFCLLFLTIGLITWLFGRQIERSLFQARAAETALLEEKNMLAVRLKQKTENLRAAQLQEMQQLYRFAQLGQLSTALLHDLANHLTSLTLDIEDLQQQQHTEAIERAKQSISHLDQLVAGVSKQLQDKGEITTFNALHNIQEVVAALRPRFAKHRVALDVEHTGSRELLRFTGDPLRFSQILNILVINSLDATCPPDILKDRRQVRVELKALKSRLEIRVSDWGNGIPDAERHKLFTPFYSTKAEGMGVGLFITEQIVKTHFHGSIRLESAVSPTLFTIILPRRKRHVAK